MTVKSADKLPSEMSQTKIDQILKYSESRTTGLPSVLTFKKKCLRNANK